MIRKRRWGNLRTEPQATWATLTESASPEQQQLRRLFLLTCKGTCGVENWSSGVGVRRKVHYGLRRNRSTHDIQGGEFTFSRDIFSSALTFIVRSFCHMNLSHLQRTGLVSSDLCPCITWPNRLVSMEVWALLLLKINETHKQVSNITVCACFIVEVVRQIVFS